MRQMLRNNRKKTAFTLTELIIYMFISSLAIGTILTIYFFVQKTYWKSAASFTVQQEASTAVYWIKRDLLTTSLNSITVYPNKDFPAEAPGVSFISAVRDNEMQVSPSGVPKWDRYVFYTIVPNNHNPADGHTPWTGRLIRWEMPIEGKNPIPAPTSVLPSQYKLKGMNIKTVLKSVMAAGGPDMKGFERLRNGSYDNGGFRVAFVRKEKDDDNRIIQKLSDENPSKVTDADGKVKDVWPSATTTSLVQADFIVLLISNTTGKPSAFSVSFQVCPRN